MKVTYIRTVGTFPQTPVAVVGLTATVISSAEIDLTWTGIAGAQNYTVRVFGNPVSTQPTTGVNFTMLAPATQYSFTVAAINALGEGPQSAPVVATTQPAAVVPGPITGLTATAVSTTEIDLTWVAATNASSYNVVRGGVSVGNPTGPSFNDTGLAQGTTYNYTVTGLNNAGVGPGQNAAATTPSAETGGLRANYGMYPSFYYSGGLSTTHFTNSDHGVINASASVPQIAGFHGQSLWRSIDAGVAGAAGPAYNWTVLDEYVNACAAAGKQAWFCLAEAFISSGSTVANGGKVVPDWISAQMGGVQFSTINYKQPDQAGGVATKRYSATLIGYWIKFLTAFVARYDNNPNVEGFTIWEETAYNVDTTGTSVTTATPGADFSGSQQIPQMLRVIAAVRDTNQINAQNLNFCIGANYLFQGQYDTQANWDSVFKALEAAQGGFQGPDTWLQSWTCPCTPLTAVNYPQQNANAATNLPHSGNTGYYRSLPADNYYRGWFGGTDYRGKVICFPRCEVTDLGGYITQSLSPVPTPGNLYTTRMTYDRPQYFSFDVITVESGYTGNGTGAFPGAGPAQQWSTGGLPFIKTLTVPTTSTVNPY